MIPAVDKARCTGCGGCQRSCSAGAITLTEGKAQIDAEICCGCGVCITICPSGALSEPAFSTHLFDRKFPETPNDAAFLKQSQTSMLTVGWRTGLVKFLRNLFAFRTADRFNNFRIKRRIPGGGHRASGTLHSTRYTDCRGRGRGNCRGRRSFTKEF